MKITLLQAASNGYRCLLDLTGANQAEYCQRHEVRYESPSYGDVPAYGDRERFMLNYIEDCDWLWFMGADALVTNHTVDIRQFIEDVDFIIAWDWGYINNDVMLIRNCAAAKSMLKAVMEGNYPNDQEGMGSIICPPQAVKSGSVIWSAGELRCKMIHQKNSTPSGFNAYPYKRLGCNVPDGEWSKGDFIMHLPSVGNEIRLKIMRDTLSEIVR